MNSEYYTGWLTHWNESLQQASTQSVASTLRTMLDKNFNVNFYVYFGGSNFEFSSGMCIFFYFSWINFSFVLNNLPSGLRSNPLLLISYLSHFLGANYDTNYLPDITSYDYDAPLSESGDPTEKYYVIRNILSEVMTVSNIN